MKTEDIRIDGEAIESFERVSKIKEIILLGEDGNIRRIIVTEHKGNNSGEKRK